MVRDRCSCLVMVDHSACQLKKTIALGIRTLRPSSPVEPATKTLPSSAAFAQPNTVEWHCWSGHSERGGETCSQPMAWTSRTILKNNLTHYNFERPNGVFSLASTSRFQRDMRIDFCLFGALSALGLSRKQDTWSQIWRPKSGFWGIESCRGVLGWALGPLSLSTCHLA